MAFSGRNVARSGLALVLTTVLVAGCAYDRRGPSGAATSEADAIADSPTDTGEAWVRLPDMPTSRSEVGAAYLDGRIYVAGGLGVSRGGEPIVLSSFEAYDNALGEWRKLPELPEPRHHAAVAALDGKVYIMGGYTDLQFTPSDKVFVYDTASGRWSQGVPLPEPLGAGGAAVLDDTVYFVGGAGSAKAPVARVFALHGERWIAKNEMPTPREHLAVAATDAFLYAVGGRFPITDAAERYDPDSDSWATIAPKPTPRGGIAGAGVAGRFACAAGGEDPSRTYADAECYDEQSGQWRVLPPLGVPRHGVGAAAGDGTFYVVGGGDRPGLSATGVFEAIRVQ